MVKTKAKAKAKSDTKKTSKIKIAEKAELYHDIEPEKKKEIKRIENKPRKKLPAVLTNTPTTLPIFLKFTMVLILAVIKS